MATIEGYNICKGVFIKSPETGPCGDPVLRLRALNVGGPGSNPGQETINRFHMQQLMISHVTAKSPACCTYDPVQKNKQK